MISSRSTITFLRASLLLLLFAFAVAGNLGSGLSDEVDEEEENSGPADGEVLIDLSVNGGQDFTTTVVQGESLDIVTDVSLIEIAFGGSDAPTFRARSLPVGITESHVYSAMDSQVTWTIQTSLDTDVSGETAFPERITLEGVETSATNPDYTSGLDVRVRLNVVPADLPPQTASPMAIGAGARSSMALLGDGTARIWGRVVRTDGSGIGVEDYYLPYDPGLTDVSELELGGFPSGNTFSLARLTDGSVVSWGSNFDGQLGDGTFDDRGAPAPVMSVANTTGIAVNGATSLAVLSDGTLMSWGQNDEGQLGNGTIGADDPVPQAVTGLDSVDQIAGGTAHFVARRDGGTGGTVWTWGFNSDSQLGHSLPTNDSGTPAQVPGLAGVQAVAAGGWSSYALLGDNTLRAWGSGERGELGNGMMVDSGTPVQVSGLNNVSGMARSGKGNHIIVMLDDNTPRAWGANAFGQVGDGPLVDTPLAAPVPLSDVLQVAHGGDHSLALQSDGNCSVVWAWGRNSDGQLGDGSLTFSFEQAERFRTYPAPVKGIGELDCSALGIYIAGNGSVATDIGTLDCQGAFCSELFAVNDMPNLTATPDNGNFFVGWGDDCGNADGTLDPNLSIQVLADRHLQCTAEFQLGAPPNQPPTADFSFMPAAPAVNDLVSFDANTSSDPDGSIVSYEWDFEDDGTFDTTGVMADNTYTTAGDFTVRLRVTDDMSAMDEATQLVSVVAGPGTFTLSFVVTGNGSVGDNTGGIDCPTDCMEDFAANDIATLFANPDLGFELTGWGGDCAFAGTSTGFNLTMDSDKNCTADFGPAGPGSDLTVTAVMSTGDGTVTSDTPGIDCFFFGTGSDPDPCTANFSSGAFVTLTATPTGGSGFLGWGGDCAFAGTNAMCTLDMSVDRNVTVSFE